MDAELFFMEWCWTKKITRNRRWVLKNRVRRLSRDERTDLTRFVLDRAAHIYFDPRFGAKNRVIHNIYHTLRSLHGINDNCLLMLSFALRIQHCYLHDRVFSLMLRHTDPQTALEAVEAIYRSSEYQRRGDYIRALSSKITGLSKDVLQICVTGIVNSWGDREAHEGLLFHPSVRLDQYRDLLLEYIRRLGTAIEECLDFNTRYNMTPAIHQQRLKILDDVVDRILVMMAQNNYYPLDGSEGFSASVGCRVTALCLHRRNRDAVMREIRDEVAFRPGMRGALEAMEDFMKQVARG